MSQIDQQFIEFYQNIGRSQGINDNLLTTIMAILFLEPEEIAMEDVAKKTGYSLASISNKVKMLEAIGFVKRRSKPGTRKAYLYAEKDFLKVFKQALIKKQENVINLAKSTLPNIIKENKPKAKTKEQKQKIKMIENYFQQMLKFEKIIQHMIQGFNNIDKIK
tara:strand:+ start:6316 stop:6804 length:489 start_codon:yes stop_codon:yes gene_type:complete